MDLSGDFCQKYACQHSGKYALSFGRQGISPIGAFVCIARLRLIIRLTFIDLAGETNTSWERTIHFFRFFLPVYNTLAMISTCGL
jgi:hypothetical protein